MDNNTKHMKWKYGISSIIKMLIAAAPRTLKNSKSKESKMKNNKEKSWWSISIDGMILKKGRVKLLKGIWCWKRSVYVQK